MKEKDREKMGGVVRQWDLLFHTKKRVVVRWRERTKLKVQSVLRRKHNFLFFVFFCVGSRPSSHKNIMRRTSKQPTLHKEYGGWKKWSVAKARG